MQIIKIDQSDPDPVVVSEIAGLLKSGAVIAFPTDTYYGLGADIYNDDAIKRIFDIKGRPHDRPILILISDREDLMPLISTRDIPVFADRLMDEFWPGPLTIVFHASEGMSDVLDAIGDRIDALVDGGMTEGGAVSTVIDATGAELVVIREGVISENHLREVLSGERS